MTIALPDIGHSNLAVSVISALITAVITVAVTKLLAKTKRLRYSTKVERLALSTNDPIFGSIGVTWGNMPVRNLFMVWVEVENCSNHDFDNVDLKIYTVKETFLFSERTAMVNTPYAVLWAPDYRASLAVPPGGAPTAAQFETYNHHRDYFVPVLNRGQLLQFSYLCSRPLDDLTPAVFVGTQLKGAKLKHEVRSSLVFGIPQKTAITRGLLISALIVGICGLALRNVWAASGISMAVGLFAQALGAAEYKAERWLWRALTG